MFMPRFWDQIKSGTKRQTVRVKPKRSPKVGEVFSGRGWSGKPYRSKQVRLVDEPIVRLASIDMWVDEIDGELMMLVNGIYQVNRDRLRFALSDGFTSVKDMQDTFAKMRELPLKDGCVIYW